MLILCKFVELLLFFVFIGIFAETSEFSLDKSELDLKLSLRILKAGNLDSEPVKRGTKIQLKIKSFSPQLNPQITSEITQTFIVSTVKPHFTTLKPYFTTLITHFPILITQLLSYLLSY